MSSGVSTCFFDLDFLGFDLSLKNKSSQKSDSDFSKKKVQSESDLTYYFKSTIRTSKKSNSQENTGSQRGKSILQKNF